MVKEILRIRNYIDGANDTSFPNETNPIDITAYNFTANRMGSVSLSASFMYPEQIDDLWDGTQYVEFRGEKFFLDQVPTSSKDTSDMRYKYEADFYSERKILESVYFFDVVTEDTGNDKYQSNSPSVTFYGDINEFVKRLNYSLKYSNLKYTVVIDDGITSEAKQVSLENEFIMDALQQTYEIFGLPFYFVGRVIHIGYTENAIAVPFAYGYDRELLSITKTNADYKIVNRCTGTGSSDNIPYYYPNETDDRSEVEASGKKWITPSSTLMPPIYRESEGAERFYNAVNNTYPSGSGGYYTFENEYKGNNPKEQIVEFSDIKPTIKGVTNASGQRIDLFVDFAYDSDDNDDVDPETGEYLHPYFYAKLRKMDGEYGFNLFEHAIADNTNMTISMTSGNCAGCSFEIGVVESVVDGKQVFRNPVQVDENGDIVEGTYADKVKPENIQDVQQDTSTNSVWIALKKDIGTFGTILPSVNNNYKPTAGDSFVILYIDLPLAYVTAAEKRLEDNIIAYMLENNSSKFNFSVEFSKIYFAENPDTLALMNENSRLILEYNNKEYTLYISSFSYKVTDDSPLPTITVDLEDTITVRKGALETAIDSITGDLVSGGFGDIIAQGTKYFLRKDIDDETKGKLTSRKGFDVGRFSSLVSGGTFRLDAGNKSYIEVDRLYVRLKAYFETLEIKRVTHVGGEQLITPASMKCNEVEDKGTFYRCYFLQEQDGETINNEFAINDQAICKQFDPKSGSQVTNHYFWRLVVGTGVNYIDLSKEDCDTASDAPMAGDVIVQLGHRTDASRQNAIIQSAYSVDAPSIKFLQGINSYSLDGKDIISQGFDSTTRRAFMNVVGDMFFGNRDESSYMKYDPENGLEIKGKIITKGGDDLDTVLDQFSDIIDGAIETWFYDPVPTLDNEPAVNWATDDDKKTHLGDLYYSGEGKAYRFQKEGDQYIWKEIVDSDITEALALAKKAQQTADAAAQSVTNLNNYVDGAFKDGVIDDAEAIAIEKYKNSVNETRQAVEGTYKKIYGNVYLEDPAKSNLKSAYDELSLSITALLDTIDNAIVDMTTTDEEKEAVDMAYSNFSNMMQAYNEAVEEANEAIQNKLKSFTDEVGERVDGYEYLKKALENDTTIEGGLIATSLVSTGYKESGKFVIKSGINGIYDSGKLGGGISYWAGGNIIDREEYDDEASIPENAATAVIRMDGTGYLANGNISWDSDGRIYADPMSFIVGDKLIGDLLDMFSAIKNNTNKIIGISALYPMTVNGDIISTNDIICKSTSTAISDAELPIASKTQLGLIKIGTGFEITADGTLNNTGTGGLTEVFWDDVKMKPTTFAPSPHTHTKSQITDFPTKWAWNDITGKPSTLAGYGITDAYTKTQSNDRYLTKTGNAASASKLSPGCKIWGRAFTGDKDVSGNMTGVGSIDASGEIRSTSANAFRIIYGDYGFFIRNDGNDTWFMLTNSGDKYGSYNGLRPLRISNSSGNVSIGNGSLFVQHGGSIGIGTSDPKNKLHVVGNGMFTGSLHFTRGTARLVRDDYNYAFIFLTENGNTVIRAANNAILSLGYGGQTKTVDFYVNTEDLTSKGIGQFSRSGLTIGTVAAANAMLDVRGDGLFTGDVIAKSTSSAISDAELPIASKTQLGLIKVGSGFEITADGTLNNTGTGGLTEVYWDDIKNPPTTLAGYGITDAYTKTQSDDRYLTKTGNAASASKLSPGCKIWGQAFTGEKDITGSLRDVANIYMRGNPLIYFAGDNLCIGKNSSTDELYFVFRETHFKPYAGKGGTIDIGTSSDKFRHLYLSNDAYINGNIAAGTTDPQAKLHVVGDALIAGRLRTEQSSTSYTHAFTSINKAITGTDRDYKWIIYHGITGVDRGLSFWSYDLDNTVFNQVFTIQAHPSNKIIVRGMADVRGDGLFTGDVIAKSTSSAISDSELPIASKTQLGLVKVGSGLKITNGVLSATGGGVQGETGPQGQGVTYRWSGTSLQLGTIPVGGGVTTWGSPVNLKGQKGDRGATGPQGPKGDDGRDGTLSASTICYLPSAGTIFTTDNKLGVKLSGGNGIVGTNNGIRDNLYFNYVSSAKYVLVDGNANLTCKGTIFYANLSQDSDLRLKNVLGELNGVLDIMSQIPVIEYQYKADEDKINYYGFGAQSFIGRFRNIATLNNDHYTINTSGIVAIAFQGVKELYALQKQTTNEIDVLKQRIAILEAENQNLWNIINEINDKEAA